MEKMATPAEKLKGQILKDGWHVINIIERPKDSTGGFFSVGYYVESEDGKRGFLKAIDIQKSFQIEEFSFKDPARITQQALEVFNFERDILNLCKSKKMSRIVVPISDGYANVDSYAVPYIIFELSDCNIREKIDWSKGINMLFNLQVLHNVTVGLGQLQSIKVAHQDLKPSNVLCFDNNINKIADLGRSACKDMNIPESYRELPVAGDLGYAPPELLFNGLSLDWEQRRFGCDSYLLGSLVMYLFTGHSAASLLKTFIGNSIDMPDDGKYESILPYLTEAHSRVTIAFKQHLDNVFSEEYKEVKENICNIYNQLCNPDIERRCHPKQKSKNSNKYSVERYISIFDRLMFDVKVIIEKNKIKI